jgi:hypothetical protein
MDSQTELPETLSDSLRQPLSWIRQIAWTSIPMIQSIQ